MPPGMQRPVFSLGDDSYTWQDVLAHARATGTWSELEQAAREGVACELLADTEPDEADEEAIDHAAEEFRYERDLVTAAEMEAWLAERELSAEDWMGHIRRVVLREAWQDRLEDIVAEQEPDAELVSRALEVDLACSGEDMLLARQFAEDVAVVAALEEQVGPDADARTHGRAGVRALGLPAILAAAEKYRDLILTDEAIAREVSAAHMDWIRLDCQALAFTSENEAREAALCLREDGIELEVLARDARIDAEDVSFYLSDLEPNRRALFLSARVGEAVGPLMEDDLHTLYQVTAKTLPSVEDADVAARAREAILSRQLEAEVTHRVQWHADIPSQ